MKHSQPIILFLKRKKILSFPLFLLVFAHLSAQTCPGLGAITLTVVPVPVPTLTFNNLLCVGQSTTIAVNQTFNSYSWSGGLGVTQTVSVNAAGTYTVTVSTASGCTATASATISQQLPPIPGITQMPNCTGTIVLNATPGYTTYSWSNGGGSTAMATFPGAGTYTVTVSNSSGCTGTSSFTATIPPPPVVAITGNTSLCSGQSTTLNATTGFSSYAWTGGGSSSANLSVATAGTYTVTVTNTAGCTATSSVVVSSQVSPVPTVSSGQSCAFPGATVTIGVTNPPFASYAWSSGGGNGVSATYSAAGPYTVTVTDINGCTGTGTGVVTLTPFPTINVTPNPYNCNGQIVLNATPLGLSSYNWSNGSTGPTATYTGAGPYSITVTGAAGCTSTTSGFVVIPAPPVVTISGSNLLCSGQSTVLNATPGFASYAWTGSGSVSAALNVTNASTYTVTVTDNFGCTATSSTAITAQISPLPTVSNGQACQGAVATLNVTNAPFDSYAWSSGGGNSSSATYSISNNYTVTVTAANGCTGTGVGTVVINALPNVVITQSPYACNGQIVLNATPGSSSYSWSNGGGSGVSATYTNSGTYTVTVTNVAGCTNTASFLINIPVAPVVNITGGLTLCPSSNTVLSATPGFSSYSWTGGGSSANLTVNSAGTYTVTVTNAFGCTATTSAVVTTLAAPIPDITGSAPVCSGGSVTLSILNGPFSAYNWSNSSSNPTITVSSSGSYTVTVTAVNGCTATAVETQVFLATPNPAIGISYSCNNSSTLSTSTPFNSYIWSNGATTQSTVITVQNTYTVTVTNGQGCTASASIFADIYSVPVVSISGPPSFCSGLSANLSATPGFNAYIWSNTQSTPAINVTNAGTYQVTVTNNEGCTGEASISVAQLPSPNPIITGPTSICAGGSATFTVATGFANYLWSNSNPSNSITTGAPGNYSITVTAANGCQGSDDINLIISNNLNINIVAQAYQCNGNLVLDAGSGFTSYAWSNAGSNSTTSVTSNGTYTVTVTDITGCTGSDTFNAVIPAAPTVVIFGPPTICGGAQALLEASLGFNQYVWSNGQLNASIQVSTAGDYTVTVTDNNGCTATSSTTLSVSPAPSPTITGVASICSGNAAVFSLLQVYNSYLWSNAATTATISVTNAGTYTVTVSNAAGCTGTDTQVLTVSTSLSPTITVQPYQCNGQYTLDASAGFLTYNWSSGSTTAAAAVNASGTYTVTVTDLSGCSGTATVSVTLPVVPTVAVSGTNAVCTGGSVALSATAGFVNYVWSNNATGASISVSPTTSTTYTVVVTDVNNCTASANFSVSVNPLPTPSITGGTTICNGANTTISVTPAFAQYLWSGAETTSSISTNIAGSYTVTVTDANNCTATTSANLVVSANLNPTIVQQSYNCDGNLTLSSDLGFANYLWNTSATTTSITVNQTGTYTVAVTDISGCSGTASITATIPVAPVVAITGGNTACINAAVALNATAGFQNYQWSSGDNTTNITVLSAATTIYTVTVTDVNNCTATTSTTVTVFPVPVATISGSTTICNGAATTLSVAPAFSQYLWSGSETTNNISTSIAATYSVTVTDANGCTTSTSIITSTANSVTPTLNLSPYDCSGSLVLNAGAGYSTYDWNTTAATTSITVNQSGVYTVSVTDANGCSGSATITATIPNPPTVAITAPGSICAGNAAVLTATTGFANYQWSQTGTNNTLTVSPVANSVYTVTVTDGNGCTGTSTAQVSVNALPAPSISGSTTICNGGTTNIGVSGSFTTYQWSNSATTANITTNLSGLYTVTVTDNNACTGTATITLVNGTNLTPLLNINPYQCNNQLIINAGAGFSTYSWNVPGAGPAIIITQSGTYSVTVSNASGCTGATSINAVIPTQNTVSIAGISAVCTGNPATLIASGGFTNYAWSPPGAANLPSITVNPTALTTYTVTATDSNGCTSTDNFEVSVSSSVPVNITGDSVICNNASTTLSAGLGFVSYQWSSGATTATITTNVAQIFTVTVTDANGCTGTDGVETIAQQAPDPTINEGNYQCDNQLVLNVQQGFAAYEWSNGLGTTSITVSQDGQYSITVTDANGCTGTNSFFANIPDALLVIIQTPSTPICAGGSASLSVTPGLSAYQWSNGTLVNAITVNQPGTYSVTVTDVFGCTAADDFAFSLAPNPTVSITGDVVICDGATGILTATSNAGNFQWSSGALLASISVNSLAPTTYTVTVTDSNNCTATASQLVESSPAISIALTNEDPSCTKGGTLTFQGVNGGNAPFEVSISNSIGDFETDGVLAPADYVKFTGIAAGNYSVLVTDATGCTATEDIAFTTIPFTEFFADTIEFVPGQQIPLNPPITITPVDISWTNSSILSCANCPTPIASPQETILVEYTVDGQGPCQSNGFYLLVTSKKGANIYVPNTMAPSDDNNFGFTIYGDANLLKIKTLQVYDRWGGMMAVYQNILPNDPSAGWDGRYRNKLVDPGVYVFWVEVELADGETRTLSGDITVLK